MISFSLSLIAIVVNVVIIVPSQIIKPPLQLIVLVPEWSKDELVLIVCGLEVSGLLRLRRDMSVGGTSRGMLDTQITIDHAPNEVACRRCIEKAANDGEGVEFAEQSNKDEAENGQRKNYGFEVRHICKL